MASYKRDEWTKGDRLKLVKGWARSGMSNDEIAKKIGISRGTFYTWKKECPDFLNALKEGEIYDREVEESLQKAAMGGTYKEVTRTTNKMTGEVIVKETIKEVPPNVTAIIFWLKNRMPEQWRNNPTTDGKETLKALDAVLEKIDSAF